MHLLSGHEVKALFGDVVSGLAFLVSDSLLREQTWFLTFLQHDKTILHLDLKPGNVLLTWDEEALM